MLVGQDWGCPWHPGEDDLMQKIRDNNSGTPFDYLHGNTSITDIRLAKLFREIGYDIGHRCKDLFFTNFILGYRNKGTSGGYKSEWAKHDKGYFKELADIIGPKVILCLGRSTFEGVLSAFDRKLDTAIKDYNDFIESECNPVQVILENGSVAHVFALAHCGAMGTLNRNRKKSTDLDNQLNDWRRIREYLD
jgi:uracil-DNA glycosylase